MIRTYPRAHLDLMLLGVLARKPCDPDSALAEVSRYRGARFQVPRRAIFSMFRELERNRLVGRDADRPQTFHLTGSGRRALRYKRREWDHLVAGMTAILGPASDG